MNLNKLKLPCFLLIFALPLTLLFANVLIIANDTDYYEYQFNSVPYLIQHWKLPPVTTQLFSMSVKKNELFSKN